MHDLVRNPQPYVIDVSAPSLLASVALAFYEIHFPGHPLD